MPLKNNVFLILLFLSIKYILIEMKILHYLLNRWVKYKQLF